MIEGPGQPGRAGHRGATLSIRCEQQCRFCVEPGPEDAAAQADQSTQRHHERRIGAGSVDPQPVGRVEISDQRAAVRAVDLRVPSGQFGIVNPQVTSRVPTDHHTLGVKGNPATGVGARDAGQVDGADLDRVVERHGRQDAAREQRRPAEHPFPLHRSDAKVQHGGIGQAGTAPDVRQYRLQPRRTGQFHQQVDVAAAGSDGQR